MSDHFNRLRHTPDRVNQPATCNLGLLNAMRVAFRECSVELINGVLFVAIIRVSAWWWFGSDGLGLVIAAAMVINLLAAALAGILVPLALDHFDIDPAKRRAPLSPR